MATCFACASHAALQCAHCGTPYCGDTCADADWSNHAEGCKLIGQILKLIEGRKRKRDVPEREFMVEEGGTKKQKEEYDLIKFVRDLIRAQPGLAQNFFEQQLDFLDFVKLLSLDQAVRAFAVRRGMFGSMEETEAAVNIYKSSVGVIQFFRDLFDLAAIAGNMYLVKMLLEDERINPEDVTWANIRNNDVLELLIRSPLVKSVPRSVMQWAAKNGHADIVEAMLDNNRVTTWGNELQRAFKTAEENEQLGVIKAILSNQSFAWTIKSAKRKQYSYLLD